MYFLHRMRRYSCRNGMLPTIPRKLRAQSSNMGYANMLTHHHQVRDIDRVQTAKGNAIRLPITLIPFLVLQTEVIFIIPWAVQAKRPVNLHHGIGKSPVCADAHLREDVVVFIPAEFACAGTYATHSSSIFA